MWTRRLHHAAEREVRSGNLVPFATRRFFVSIVLRLALRTSRQAGLLRLLAAATATAATWFWIATCGYVVFGVTALVSLAVFVTTWRAVVPRQAWEDPTTVGVNRLPTHSRLCNYPTPEAAEARGRSPNVISLSGVWKFLLVDGVHKAPAGFESADFSDVGWSDIKVPGHWQLQPGGSRDPPIYTNTNYPFPNHPPYVPRSNPTGLYRRNFALPSDWFHRPGEIQERSPGQGHSEVALSDRLKGRVVLVLHGVDSAFHVWVNGLAVGFAKGSRLPCEFDVTDALTHRRTQGLCLRVVRWSDGSYLEDQDHWWMSGIYREVDLALRPKPARIVDFVVRPFLNADESGRHTRGYLEVEVLVEQDRPGAEPYPRSSCWPRGRRVLRGGATVVSYDGSAVPSLLSVGDLETGLALTDRSPQGERSPGGDAAFSVPSGDDASFEVTCELVDGVAGRRYSLDDGGRLPDWQLGAPPTLDGLGSSRLGSAEAGETRGGTRPPPPSGRAAKFVRLFRLEVPEEVRPWSAEDPQLYTLVVGLRPCAASPPLPGMDLGWPPSQFESAKVGFRSVEVASGQLLVNGRAVMVAGVNRHEHDPTTGKNVSEESMRGDILAMKRFNFNAVRNCHYPNHWRWYELCDELGLYVCDEANIETHGQVPMGRLSADPAWRLSYLDRVWRMVAANKNHPCVILWSLGNESGDGSNLLACRRMVKDLEPSRPVVYEGGGRSLLEGCGCTELTDVVFPMYTSVEATEGLGMDGGDGVGETRPCVLCEYSHAMGNSNGNLHKYWEIFRRHRRLQGGFIWDWVDQGLTRVDPLSGREFWADGSGFGGRHSEGYDVFCINGVTFPDRSPHPAIWEAMFLAQPVEIVLLADQGKGSAGTSRSIPAGRSGARSEPAGRRSPAPYPLSLLLSLTNRYSFSSLDHLAGEWSLKSAAGSPGAGGSRSAIARGFLALDGISAGETRELGVEISVEDLSGGGEVGGEGGVPTEGIGETFLHVEIALKADTPWAQKGHVVAWACFATETQAFLEELREREPPGLGHGSARAVGRPFHRGVEHESGLDSMASRATGHQGMLMYEQDEEEDSVSSREGSPAGQLREHLLNDAPARSPTEKGIIVVKGVMSKGEESSFPRGWSLVVSREEGCIQRFQADGVDLIDPGAGPALCLWRAATDNDRAGWPTLMKFVADQRLVSLVSSFLPLSGLSHLERWESNGLSATSTPVRKTLGVWTERRSPDDYVIKTVTTYSRRRRRLRTRPSNDGPGRGDAGLERARGKRALLFRVTTEIRVTSRGEVELTTEVAPQPRALAACVSLARVGLALTVPRGNDHVEWFGRGPFESHQDRKHAAKVDVFAGAVDEQHVPYIHPCENGAKADVRWMALRRGEGGGGLLLQAEAGKPFEAASCGLYTTAELQDARTTLDLPPRTASRDPVFVHLDHRSMGVGGDNTWYPDVVHGEYTISARVTHRFRVRMEALAPGQSASLAALASGQPRRR